MNSSALAPAFSSPKRFLLSARRAPWATLQRVISPASAPPAVSPNLRSGCFVPGAAGSKLQRVCLICRRTYTTDTNDIFARIDDINTTDTRPLEIRMLCIKKMEEICDFGKIISVNAQIDMSLIYIMIARYIGKQFSRFRSIAA